MEPSDSLMRYGNCPVIRIIIYYHTMCLDNNPNIKILPSVAMGAKSKGSMNDICFEQLLKVNVSGFYNWKEPIALGST